MSTTFSKSDSKFLKSVGISAEPISEDRAECAQIFIPPVSVDMSPVADFTPPDDEITKLLKRFRIPITRENYLQLEMADLDDVPEELYGEIEAELERLQDEDEDKPLPEPLTPRAARYALSHAETESMTAGDCGEPNYTTPSGIPICSECGESTRNRNELVCAPCRHRTRLLLTHEDKPWLREMGIR
jgi:hypothetical protein